MRASSTWLRNYLLFGAESSHPKSLKSNSMKSTDLEGVRTSVTGSI